MNRRSFLRSSAVLAAFAPAINAAEKKKKAAPAGPPPFTPKRAQPRPNKKGFMFGTLRSTTSRDLSLEQKFRLVKDAGFQGVEMPSAMNQKEVLAARDAVGLEIPSVVCSTHWAKPLTHPSENERAVALEGFLQSLRDAKAYGAKSVLLVPAVVNKDVSYSDAWKRSIEQIKKALPLAEQLGVVIAIENVWNGFLMSPLEAAEYVDSFKSPFVQWHFDVGNVVNTGWPHHWIQVLGKRIVAVHIKEYSRSIRDEQGPGAGFRVALTEGDSDWNAVMAALDATNYTGWMIAEQYRPPTMGDAEWLSELTSKMDKILAA